MGWLNKLLGWMFPATTSIYSSVANPAFNHATPGRIIKAEDPLGLNTSKGTIQNLWDDLTGQSQIELQSRSNMALAKYQADMNEEFYNKYSSPEALMRQYANADLNPNLMYGSAGSGQGNVPNYQSPSAIRGLSLPQKLSSIMSLFSGLMNMRNIMYNSEANRELSEQSQIKTRSMLEDLSTKIRNNVLKESEIGHQFYFNIKPFWKRTTPFERYSSTDDRLLRYARAARSSYFNKMYSVYMNNMWEYGGGFLDDTLKSMSTPGWLPNAAYRNSVLMHDAEQRGFNVEWDKQFRTMMKSMGVAGQLGSYILRALK